MVSLSIDHLKSIGLNEQDAKRLTDHLDAQLLVSPAAEEAWQALSKFLIHHAYPFEVHFYIFNSLFPLWHEHPELAPASIPTAEVIATANLTKLMTEQNTADVTVFHRWSYTEYEAFWGKMAAELNIRFSRIPTAVCDLSKGIEQPYWFPNAEMNIAESCFNAPHHTIALIEEDKNKNLHKMTYGELNHLSDGIASCLLDHGYKKNDAIAIVMPMTSYAVAIYLGIIKMGGVVVSIADSFSSAEIASRLDIAKVCGVFTQDVIDWDEKTIPLYNKFCDIEAPFMNQVRIIVLASDKHHRLTSLREKDIHWDEFYRDSSQRTIVHTDPMAPCNILFSSGTLSQPKAIIWNHTTPIKAASDAYLHHDIKPNDVLAWPTNLGWMMGPWVLFAAFINQATLALYPYSPKGKPFGEFVQKAKVTMLGVIPTLVATWRQTKCMEGLDWSSIKVFSSTGECSNPEDMFYLMWLAGYKPVIEYCGGTEIGGAYLSSTVIQNNCPSLFTTPTMGFNFIILNDEDKPAEQGEIAILPPCIGLSTVLINANHHEIYYANMPLYQQKPLRRHGDMIRRYPNGYYSILGRVDDAMNLGGIKVSAAEIERVLSSIADLQEVAAIAVAPKGGGPSQLILYVVSKKHPDKKQLIKEMQSKINTYLNPLFKISDVIYVDALPKTASNKIIRRLLRKKFEERKD